MDDTKEVEMKKKWELSQWTLVSLMEKISEEGEEKYADKLREATRNLAELSLDYINSQLATAIPRLEVAEKDAKLKKDRLIVATSSILRVTFEWLQAFSRELVNERATRWNDTIILTIRLGKPLGEILQELRNEIDSLKQRKEEIKLRVPKNIQTELEEWLKERERAKRAQSQYVK